MTIFATIGATALYLLFVWLFSAAAGSWLTQRKGYGDRLGLALGLLLSALGLFLVLLLPARPESAWKLDGPISRRRSRAAATGPGQEPHDGSP
jgi:hypothetical protein